MFFVLSEGQFKYFKSDKKEDMLVPEGVFNMDHFRMHLSCTDDWIGQLYTIEDTINGLYFNIKICGINEYVFQFKA